MGKYSLTVENGVGPPKGIPFDSEEELLKVFNSKFSAMLRNKGDWSLGVSNHEEGLTFSFDKTSDGFLFMLFTYKTQYQNFPCEVLDTPWIYKFGEADKPCAFMLNGESLSYFPQCFYIPLEEARKLLQKIKEKGMKNAFSYDSDCWKNAAEETESLELASEEIRRQAFGDSYSSPKDEEDEDE